MILWRWSQQTNQSNFNFVRSCKERTVCTCGAIPDIFFLSSSCLLSILLWGHTCGLPNVQKLLSIDTKGGWIIASRVIDLDQYLDFSFWQNTQVLEAEAMNSPLFVSIVSSLHNIDSRLVQSGGDQNVIPLKLWL